MCGLFRSCVSICTFVPVKQVICVTAASSVDEKYGPYPLQYVSAYCSLCPHTAIWGHISLLLTRNMAPIICRRCVRMCVRIMLYVSSYCYMCPHTAIYVSSFFLHRRAYASLLCRMLTYADVCRRRADASLLCRASLSHPSALSRTLARVRRASLLCRWYKNKKLSSYCYICVLILLYMYAHVCTQIIFLLKKQNIVEQHQTELLRLLQLLLELLSFFSAEEKK